VIVYDAFTERDRANRQFMARTRDRRVRITEKEAAEFYERATTDWQFVDAVGFFRVEGSTVIHDAFSNRFFLVTE
jgi:hypothetical protein